LDAASDKFNKQEGEGTSDMVSSPLHLPDLPRASCIRSWVHTNTFTAKGIGASNAPATKEQSKRGEAPAASDSGSSNDSGSLNVGVDASANERGEAGIGGPNYGTR
jgi:hypothetical protein